METKNYDVCIVGAGSAGMAAAYVLKESGQKVALVEKNSMLGGTATAGWVYTWIEGVNPPYFETLFNTLKAKEKASGDLDTSMLPARFTKGANPNNNFGLKLDPDALAAQYAADMEKAPNITLLTGYSPATEPVEKSGSMVTAITVAPVDASKNPYRITARWFIDASGDGVLCRAAGCEALLGEDSYERFNEPLMEGKTPQQSLNEPSLLFKVSKGTQTVTPEEDFSYDGYLMNSMVCNPMNGLKLLGSDVAKYGAAKTYEKAIEHTPYFWDFLRRHWFEKSVYGKSYLADYRPDSYAPMLGVRETWRIVCDYMLRQQDLAEKISSANLNDYIACGSHTIDFHVLGSINREEVAYFNKNLLWPSGIPYRCLLPKALGNVWIACRAYGASHIALAARRVNKDMAQLGWAAGHAARMCVEKKLTSTREVDVTALQGDSYTRFAANVKALEGKLAPTRNLTRQFSPTVA